MSPRSLLFSSDLETSRLLHQTLHELGFEVEPCSEIFSALKGLTTKRFDVLVVDWDEGVEAGFLLKTARELKSTHAIFVIAIARADESAALQRDGANLVLSKPIAPDQVKCHLFTSIEFLYRMKTWLPRWQKLQPAKPEVEELRPVLVPVPYPVLPASAYAASEDRADSDVSKAPVNLTFASLEGGLFRKSRTPELSKPEKHIKRWSGRRSTVRRNTFLRIAAMVVAFFAVGYVSSKPISKASAAIAQFYDAPRETPRSRLPEAQVTAEFAQSEDPEPTPSDDRRSSAIRVISIRDVSRRNSTVRSSQAVEAISQPEPSTRHSASAGLHVPESLRAAFPEAAAVRTVASKISPALLDAFGPVSLPGYFAEKLLVNRVEPSYPERALQERLQGPVVLQACIGVDGKIRDLKLVRGSMVLGKAAYDAVKQWRYQPYLLNGVAVEAQTYVTVDFKLP